jgi:cytochrome c5
MNTARVMIILLLSGLLGFLLSVKLHQTKPLDRNAVQTIQTFHFPALFVKQLAGDPAAGKKIFKQFCAACHSPQPVIDIHAPAIGDKHAWKLRRKLGVNQLLAITIEGAAAMPARGGCFECSDDQLRQTIHYILTAS